MGKDVQPVLSEPVLRALAEVYRGPELEEVLRAMARPGPRYYLRVNTLKADRDSVLEGLRSRGLDFRPDENLPEAIYMPVGGPNELPDAPGAVVVDKFTAESAMMGSHVYAPGVISMRGVGPGDEVLVVSELGQPVAFGVARMSEEEVRRARRGLAVEVLRALYELPPVRELEEFREGLIYPQSLPSMLVSRILDPEPGDLVVDMTCGPGGKLSHICQLTGNMARVVGFDRSWRKIEETGEVLSRLGCEASLVKADSRYLDLDFPSLVRRADKVLLDPPCSALGVLPKLYDLRGEGELASLADYQRQFMKVAARLVKPGGVVVYSVCTMTVGECEGVVAFAVEECGLEVDEQPIYLGWRGLPGAVEGHELLQRFHPHAHGWGYFIARLRAPRLT
ncbi:16S rRNA methyltransferase [Candidatus Bathyarchaeota archaeon]|nr:MAG: 16S rRNA methyltransferase [Candidatus Bathyarchaeota archaeon]